MWTIFYELSCKAFSVNLAWLTRASWMPESWPTLWSRRVLIMHCWAIHHLGSCICCGMCAKSSILMWAQPWEKVVTHALAVSSQSFRYLRLLEFMDFDPPRAVMRGTCYKYSSCLGSHAGVTSLCCCPLFSWFVMLRYGYELHVVPGKGQPLVDSCVPGYHKPFLPSFVLNKNLDTLNEDKRKCAIVCVSWI